MSFNARNAGTNTLDILKLLSQEYDEYAYVHIEASPIYLTLDKSWSISGTYEDDTYTYDYDYTTTKQLTRESINTSIDSIQAGMTQGFTFADVLSADVAFYGTPNTDKMYVGLLPGTYHYVGGFDVSYYSPLYQGLEFVGDILSESGSVVGTKTKKSDSSTTNITQNILVAHPTFSFTTPLDGERGNLDSMNFSSLSGFNAVDISAYTVEQWRDLKGVYEFESTDGNGITTTVFWTIGGGMGLDFSSAYNSSQLILI